LADQTAAELDRLEPKGKQMAHQIDKALDPFQNIAVAVPGSIGSSVRSGRLGVSI
jgi:hypothetical protein